MITLSFTGLLSMACGITLVLLLLVIFQKESKESADKTDRVLLAFAFIGLAASLLYTGGLTMAGALVGLNSQDFTVALAVNAVMKLTFIIAGWIKIIRNTFFVVKGR